MTTPLLDALRARLDADESVADEWGVLVLAALEGEEALEQLLRTGGDDTAQADPEAATATPAPTARAAPSAYLHSITVEGFRGIGPSATLELPPGPGLTLVVGRNGSGKSSFAEALELLLTGENFRWAKRTKVWREGWRNLHHPHAALAAELALEAQPGRCRVACEWPDDGDLDAGATHVQPHGQPRTDLAALGWSAALANYRPFLSYSELGSLLEDGPSKLYDALASILGLDDLVQAQATLQHARTSREKAKKDATALRDQLVSTLDAMGESEPRARAVAEALGKKDWGLGDAEGQGEVDRLLGATPGDTAAADAELATLRALATLTTPAPDAVAQTGAALRQAAEGIAATAGTLAARSHDLVQVLDHALRFHTAHGDGDCPVCGRPGALDDAWHDAKAGEMEGLRTAARAAAQALKDAGSALDAARALPLPTKDKLESAAAVGLDPAPALAARAAWPEIPAPAPNEAPGVLNALADALEGAAPALRDAGERLCAEAEARLAAREDAWRPVATQIAQWLPLAREARNAAAAVKPLKKAEAWLKQAAEDVRNERFAPIAESALAVWERLRQQSHVSLGRIHLGGSGKVRRVELDVTVDGVAGAALGVMSQGELHSLALSLFIPRATLPESPFRFVVIDDPVQSMDPARVDGLAQVFEATAKDRQVVVFTHDDRLPEAARRLGIAAHIVEVARRDGSHVELRGGKGPVARYIEDAMAVAHTEALPAAAARRVVPGLCRGAVEAACMETVRRRRLARGEPHAQIEQTLESAGKLMNLAALALFDDPARAGDVLPRLNKEHRDWADALRACNEGAHGKNEVPGVDLVRSVEKLAAWLQKLPT